LTAIKGAVETLLDGALDQPRFARKFSEVINRHVIRLEALVMDLLELARLEGGKVKDSVNIDVKTLCTSALAAVDHLAAARRVTLRLELPENPPAVYGDPRQLEQALINLLDNAIKFTELGGRVTLKVRSDSETVRLEINDTGVGIAPEHLPRIFERFYRVDKDRSRLIGGTGLGLSIVKHTAQAHDGRVEVQSRLGQGSTFTLVLPVFS
ncbi:MAG: PAS domain-containing sensor histidine kinase, partial [Deltaproteobacteria bacterium]|nr:PAS domain-containing sensor histidine kinase [Deltaproteobacteria bacterium]